MANKSIFDAFERMWQHITVALSDKINKPSTATRGQVIAVKAVDEFNVPTEIGATDLIPIIDISTSFSKELVVDSESITMFSTYSEDSGYYDKNISRFINGVVKIKYKIGSDIYCDTAVIDFADSSNGRYRCSILNRNHAVAAGCNTLITVLFSISKTQETVTIKAESIPMKAYVDANAGGGGSSVQPDWNQNDSTQPDYMKNRTHWVEETQMVDEDITTSMPEGELFCGYELDPATFSNVKAGDKFRILLDGTTYNSIAFETGDSTNAVYIGNGHILLSILAAIYGLSSIDELLAAYPSFSDLDVNNGEPYLIFYDGIEGTCYFGTTDTESKTYHLTIYGMQYYTLDPNFIDPSALLPSVTSANDGQMLGVVGGKWVNTAVPKGLPEVTTDDNDKVLMVVDGIWVAGSIEDGDEVAY